MSHDQIGKTRMEFTDSKWVQIIFEITLRFLNTVIPQKNTLQIEYPQFYVLVGAKQSN